MPSAPTASTRQTLLGTLALLLLIVLAVARSHVGTQLDSFTVDEPWHVVAGVEYQRSGDLRLNPEHPPLVKRWVGAWMPDSFVVPPLPALQEKEQEREFVESAMFLRNDATAAQQRTRLAMWAFHALLLGALGALLWRAFGLAWVLGSVAVLAIDPTVGAHLPVAMTDLPLALTLAVAALCAGLLASTWQWRWALACGLATGLALGAKHSALAGVAGIALFLAIAAVVSRERAWRRLGMAVAAGLIAWGVLWALYGVRVHAALDGTDPFNRALADKIADLSGTRLRDAIAFADRWHLLPRAYLWGLADTVRAGVDGRGITVHVLFGHKFFGDTPWFAWPAILASKLPIATMLLALAGLFALLRLPMHATMRWALVAVLAVAAAHLAALLGSRGIWGGVRHALPVYVLVAVPIGAAFAWAWQRRSRVGAVVVGGLFVTAVGSTIAEPRLWEYHNALAGGSADAWKSFANEGLDLGQRFAEVRAVHDRVIAPSGEPMYAGYWMIEKAMQGAGMRHQRRVPSIDDTNVEGVFSGWFVYGMDSTRSLPEFGWDAEQAFRGLTLHARLGFVGIWHGRQLLPRARASGMYDAVMRYIYRDGGDDWAKVASKLEEAAVHLPHHIGVAAELSNAYLRQHRHAEAASALHRVLEQTALPVDRNVRQQMQAQLALLESTSPPQDIPLLRNAWME